MPEIVVDDVSINFPYPNPYHVQRTYMEKVVECLKNSKNGVLESPTGTGKTLSLLCASLAWLKKIKDESEALRISTNSEPRNEQETLNESPSGITSAPQIPKIIYASRTHTQLTQVINELKGTSYSYMKVGVFASRDQLCIHPELAFKDNATKTEMCETKRKKRLNPGDDQSQSGCDCSYYERFKSLQQNETFRAAHFYNKILDVEDLRTSGLNNGFCPYYMAKTLRDDADIILMPYNYLLDPKIRSFIGVELSDAVIILDEAHNVPQVCEDSASIEFKSTHITSAVEEVKKIAAFATENLTVHKLSPKTFNPPELNDLEQILLRFGKAIDDIPLSRTSNSLVSAEFDGDYIYTIMENADIGYQTSVTIKSLIMNVLNYVCDCIEELRSGETREQNRTKEITLPTQSPGLRMFKNILWTTFPNSGDDSREDIKKHYRVYATYDSSSVLHSNGRVRVINYWCFSPKFGLQYLLKRGVRSIIFTSGTMSPLRPFIMSLGISIEVQLQNDHIIDTSQVLVEIISHGPDREQLLSNFKNRSTPTYLHSLGSTVLKFCEVIPNGLLIFFPSYKILNECKTSWQNKGIWSQIERIKPIFVEPRTKSEFTHTMQKYYKQIDDATMNGAIFMAVCRGKVSEGLDFADINGRAVIVTGLPFAPIYDPKVRLKRQYVQKNYTVASESLSGQQWYQLEASRAVNQAIGRVIRHRRDYGAILLCDSRFDGAAQQSQLSRWVQQHIRRESSRRSFHAITNSIQQFFANQPSASSPVEVTSQSSDDISPTSIAADTTALQDNEMPPEALSDSHPSIDQRSLPDEISPTADTTALQDNEMPPEALSDSPPLTNQQSIPDSPMTSVTRHIASLPLSSPLVVSSENTPALTPRSLTNGTPNKQRCTVNLSQRFDEPQ